MATASASVASSVDLLSSSERKLVVEGLNLRIAQVKRSMSSETDETILSVRSSQLRDLETLVSKFR
jgi:hypothetical protein